MFENVNYNFYTQTLGRHKVPDAATFNALIPEAKRYMVPLVPFLAEREPDGIDKATCMVLEETYVAQSSGNQNGARVSSESIDSYSRSFDMTGAKSADAPKEEWILMYCERTDLR